MGRFKKLLKMECRKAMGNRFFFIVLGVGCLFALMSALYDIELYFQSRQQLAALGGNQIVQALGLYNKWIGGESYSLGFTLFFTLLPLLACFPYGWSYCIEKKSGYTGMVIIRGGKNKYFLAKYIATFLSGGVAVLIPLVFNFITVACYVPGIKPSIIYQMYYSVSHSTMWSAIFYTRPLIYVLLYLMLDFLFAGLFAVLALTFSIFLKNRLAVVLLPYIFILCLHYGRTLLYYHYYVEISPLNFLHASCVENSVNGWIVLGEGVFLFLISFGIIMKAGATREIL